MVFWIRISLRHKQEWQDRDGREEDEAGAHCKGHNSRPIGICLVCRAQFSKAQMQSLHILVGNIKERTCDVQVNAYPA